MPCRALQMAHCPLNKDLQAERQTGFGAVCKMRQTGFTGSTVTGSGGSSSSGNSRSWRWHLPTPARWSSGRTGSVLARTPSAVATRLRGTMPCELPSQSSRSPAVASRCPGPSARLGAPCALAARSGAPRPAPAWRRRRIFSPSRAAALRCSPMAWPSGLAGGPRPCSGPGRSGRSAHRLQPRTCRRSGQTCRWWCRARGTGSRRRKRWRRPRWQAVGATKILSALSS
mmetsp:Transcript_95392/g.294261  ORF Transcript_95392/g.294261 Transcript_95392/m.294261 type:complete len:228 (+) Transcript_95392:158-841(+)